MSATQLVFTVKIRPVSSNHLYPGKAHRYPSMDGLLFKQYVHEAALFAADRCGWDLGYGGPASIDIIDFRRSAQGVDAGNIEKSIVDALQPPTGCIMLNDREVWDTRTRIVIDSDPRIVVIVRQTTRAAIADDVARLLVEVATVA